MKKNNLALLLWIFLISSCWLYGQSQNKVVLLEKNMKILELASTENYVSIKAGIVNPKGFVRKMTAFLFDKSGNKLLEKPCEGGILEAEPVEPLNYYIVIDEHRGEGYDGLLATDDIIHAYDIKTGTEVWRAYANAEGYVVSPDGKHLMSRANAIEGGSSGSYFTIFNLNDGSKITNNIKLGAWSADWLDTERIVIAIQQVKPDPETRSYFEDIYKKDRNRDSRIDSLIQIRQQYAIEFRIGKISKQDYDTQWAVLTNKIDELLKQRNEETRIRSMGPHKHTIVSAASKLMIYNIWTGQIELAKEIYTPNGEPIIIHGSGEPDIGTINVERASHMIYFYASMMQGQSSTWCIAKLDTSLNVLMVASINAARLVKLNVEDEIYFVAKRKGDRVLVDKSTGKLVPTKTISTKIGEIDLESNLSDLTVPVKTLDRYIHIKEKSNSIEFSAMKEGKQ